jgi:hypothetical protein
LVSNILRFKVTLSLLFVVSCSNSLDPDCNDFRDGIIEVDISDTVKVNQVYDVEVTYGAPNLCYKFKELTTSFDNSNLIINAAICNTQKSNEGCPQSPLYGEETTTIVFKREGKFSIVINDDSFYKTVWVEE